jgi:hypothetical protein
LAAGDLTASAFAAHFSGFYISLSGPFFDFLVEALSERINESHSYGWRGGDAYV